MAFVKRKVLTLKRRGAFSSISRYVVRNKWISKQDRKLNDEYDVIIVGSGMAGFSSALSCYHNHNVQNILILEAANKIGGTTARSGGAMWFPKPIENQISIESYINYLTDNKQGSITDKRDIKWIEFFVKESYNILNEFFIKNEIFPGKIIPYSTYYKQHPLLADYIYSDKKNDIKDMIGYGHTCGIQRSSHLSRNWLHKLFVRHKDFLAKYASRDWMIFRILLNLTIIPFDVWSKNICSGLELIKFLHKACKKSNGIEIKTNQKVTSLLWAEENNNCIGVTVNNDFEFYSKYGVIFANGGYASNRQLCDKYLPIQTYTTCAVKQSMGDFIDIINDFNANSKSKKIKLRNLDKAWYAQNTLHEYISNGRNLPPFIFTIWTLHGKSMFVVNKYGQRFMNEKTSYHNKLIKYYIPNIDKDNDYKLTFLIFNEKIKLQYPLHPSSHYIHGKDIDQLTKNIEKYLDDNSSYIDNFKLDNNFATNLKNTLSKFNQMAKTGNDYQFNRGDSIYDKQLSTFIGDDIDVINNNKTMMQFERDSDLYCLILITSLLDTKGGPDTNIYSQVLYENDQVVHGLYAAGNCASTFTSNSYFGAGTTLAQALIMGYQAGKYCVK